MESVRTEFCHFIKILEPYCKIKWSLTRDIIHYLLSLLKEYNIQDHKLKTELERAKNDDTLNPKYNYLFKISNIGDEIDCSEDVIDNLNNTKQLLISTLNLIQDIEEQIKKLDKIKDELPSFELDSFKQIYCSSIINS